MSLPYPNMDFTPLDTLTAAEMNHLSANDQALDQAATSRAAIYYTSRAAVNQTIQASTETTVLFPTNEHTDTEGVVYSDGTFTVKKAGVWFIAAETGGSSNCQHTTEIIVNDSEYFSSRACNTAGANYVGASCCVKLQANDTFKIKVYAGGEVTINSRAKGNMHAYLLFPA